MSAQFASLAEPKALIPLVILLLLLFLALAYDPTRKE